MVPEGRRLFSQMTVLENLEVGASVGQPEKQDLTRSNGFMAFPVLSERKKQRAGTLSGGEQQIWL